MDEPLPQTLQQAFHAKWPAWSETKLARWVQACDDVEIWDVDDLKLYKDADIDKLEKLSKTLRLALCELRNDLEGESASQQFEEMDTTIQEIVDIGSPPPKKPRLTNLPTLSTSKVSPKKKVNVEDVKISSFFSSWTRVVSDKTGGTVSYDVNSASVQYTPADT